MEKLDRIRIRFDYIFWSCFKFVNISNILSSDLILLGLVSKLELLSGNEEYLKYLQILNNFIIINVYYVTLYSVSSIFSFIMSDEFRARLYSGRFRYARMQTINNYFIPFSIGI